MKVIGVTGFARAGKDTFCNIAIDILKRNGFKAKQFSFAEQLKKEIAPFLKEMCGVDVWTVQGELKEDVRDFLVWYGTTFWRKRDPKRWIRGVDLALKDNRVIDVAIISDVRYPNEGEWVHSWGGYLVHISSYRTVPGEYLYNADAKPTILKRHFSEAPNNQERINDPLVKRQSDYSVEWETKGLTPEQAVKDMDFYWEVLKALNSCSWFTDALSR